MTSISEFDSKSDSISLAKIGDAPFTIIGVEDSNYDEGENSTEGVKITTKETFEGVNKLHTTRVAIVKKLKNPAVLRELETNPIGPVKCSQATSSAGKKFFTLVDA